LSLPAANALSLKPVPKSALPEWRYAHGEPLVQGLIKQSPSDFQVTECLGFEPSSDGEHDFLWVEKEDTNTHWVAEALAEHAGVPLRDVGYAGLKDRHAVTRQWFSVRRPSGAGTDWSQFSLPKVRLLKITRHQKKLKRGAHAANQFRIAIRGNELESDEVIRKLELIRSQGVPNYFGAQRFGREAGNLDLARRMFAGKRLSRDKRSIALSAARSWIFNEILSSRVAAGTWNKALAGDTMNLDGTNSVFVPDQMDEEIQQRTVSMDIHPTGAMWGEGDSASACDASELEVTVAARFADLVRGLEKARVKKSRRSLRLVVRNLEWEFSESAIWLQFSLSRGSFATSVLREIVSAA